MLPFDARGAAALARTFVGGERRTRSDDRSNDGRQV
jgi:hypothetical protein